MSGPLIPGTSRVVHANRVHSYGVGSFVRPAGPGGASVQFDSDRAARTVKAADLADENGIPLVLRPPYRVIYPTEKKS